MYNIHTETTPTDRMVNKNGVYNRYVRTNSFVYRDLCIFFLQIVHAQLKNDFYCFTNDYFLFLILSLQFGVNHVLKLR